MDKMLWINSIKSMYDFIDDNKKFSVSGAGIVARSISGFVYSYKRNLESINNYIVSNYNENPFMLFNRRVYLAELIEDKNELVIIASSMELQKEIAEYLTMLGYTNLILLGKELYDELFDGGKGLPEISYFEKIRETYINELGRILMKKNVPLQEIIRKIDYSIDTYSFGKYKMTRLVVMLGTKCSLRCKDCHNLIPYIKPQSELPIEDVLSPLENIINNCENILRCELLGGEPFLAKNLKLVLEYLISKDNIYQVEITTNGTILPSEDLVPYLKNKKVEIRLSEYIALQRTETFTHFMKKHDIAYEKLKIDSWILSGGYNKRIRNTPELKKMYRACSDAVFCKTLYNGKIFACARAAGLDILGAMECKEYLQVDEQLDVNKIREFFERDFSLACDYCDYTAEGVEMISPAVQLDT